MAKPGKWGRPGQMGIYINPSDLIRASKTIMRSRDVVLDVAQAAFIKVTQQIKSESQSIVPFKTGALKRSAYKFVNRRAWQVEAEVGYDRYGQIGYAYERHQVKARNYTTPGTDYLYLLRAFDKYADDIADIIAASARKRFMVSSSVGSTQVWSED
jgi:hypothetical protein